MYKHKPLEQPDHVRLILLLPGTFNEPLSCRLLHCQRTPSIPYTALSYVWGDSGFSDTLLVRGETGEENAVMPYSVTRSLYKALQSLRPLYEPLFIWADQICINQFDNAEKSYQVAHMSSIYRNASSVTIWLGDYEGRHELEGLNKLAELGRLETPEKLVALLLESELRDHALSLQFFQRSWWTRTWTMQEFLLGRNTEYRIGGQTINEDTVGKACKVISDPKFATTIEGLALLGDMLDTLRPVRTLFECKDLLQRTNGGSLRRFVLDLSRNKSCGDNRDRVYALVGVANNKVPVVPDYSLSEAEVYKSFAVSCLLSGDLLVLDECTTPVFDLRSGVGLRSYVPNLHLEVHRPEPLRRLQTLNPNHRQWLQLTFSSGKAFTVQTATCYLDGMKIRGVLLDVTAKSMGFPRKVGDRSDTKKDQQIETTDFYGFDTMEAATQGYKHCLRWRKELDACADDEGVDGGGSHHLRPYESLKTAYFRTISGNDQRCPDHHNHYDFYRTENNRTLYTSRHYMRRRVLFMTRSGYLGLGPSVMKPQDRIVIFDGAETPFVLRPYGNDYLVVGLCLVHGWMDGDYFGHAILNPFSRPQTEGVDPTYTFVPPNHDGLKVLTKQDFCIY